jgi:hypothetical protein
LGLNRPFPALEAPVAGHSTLQIRGFVSNLHDHTM